MNRPTWDQRIARAGELAEIFPFAAEVLGFYASVARFQKALYGYIQQARGKSPLPGSFLSRRARPGSAAAALPGVPERGQAKTAPRGAVVAGGTDGRRERAALGKTAARFLAALRARRTALHRIVLRPRLSPALRRICRRAPDARRRVPATAPPARSAIPSRWSACCARSNSAPSAPSSARCAPTSGTSRAWCVPAAAKTATTPSPSLPRNSSSTFASKPATPARATSRPST